MVEQETSNMNNVSSLNQTAAVLLIQNMARRRMAKKLVTTRKHLRTKRDILVQKLAPLYEELYELPAAKDEVGVP